VSAPRDASEAELLAALTAVTGAFTRLGVSYFITGSVASSIHGAYRATNDVDLVADLEHADLEALVAQLSPDFVADLDQARAARAARSSFNLIHRSSYLKVDVFPCLTAFDREAARRAEPITPRGAEEPLRVATREDILLAKLRWYRQGDEQSEVQRRDIQGLVALNRDDLDRDYLRRWASALGVSDLLARFLG
jgi:hypothetical protein